MGLSPFRDGGPIFSPLKLGTDPLSADAGDCPNLCCVFAAKWSCPASYVGVPTTFGGGPWPPAKPGAINSTTPAATAFRDNRQVMSLLPLIRRLPLPHSSLIISLSPDPSLVPVRSRLCARP